MRVDSVSKMSVVLVLTALLLLKGSRVPLLAVDDLLYVVSQSWMFSNSLYDRP